MESILEIAKGIHPGLILKRELQKRNLSQGQFALSIKAYPQTINAIIKGKRNMNVPLAMRIEDALEMEEGILMKFQIFYEIKEEKKKQSMKFHPVLSKFRPTLFWDTRIENIDWDKQRKPVIKRIFERGNFSEKKEAVNFYGRDIVKKILAEEKIKKCQ